MICAKNLEVIGLFPFGNNKCRWLTQTKSKKIQTMTTLEIRLKEINRMTETTIKRTFAELRVGDTVIFNENRMSRIESVVKTKTYTYCEFADETTQRFFGLVTCLLQEESMKA